METDSTTPPTPLSIKNFAQRLMDEERIALQEMKGFCLKFYEWKKQSITFGCLLKSEDYLIEKELDRFSIDCAKRPTGGGLLFHINDVSFSLLIPKSSPLFRENVLESYKTINRLVAKSLKEVFFEEATFFEGKMKDLKFCFATPTLYDIFLFGKKIGGSAQRRTNQGILHQASLQLKMPSKTLLNAVLKNPQEIIKEMEKISFSLSDKEDIAKIQGKIKASLSNLIEENIKGLLL